MQLGNSASSVRHREVWETAALLWFMSRLKLRTRRDERKNYFFAAAAFLSSSLQPDINQGNFRAISAKTGIRLPDNSVRSSFFIIFWVAMEYIPRETAIVLIISRQIYIWRKKILSEQNYIVVFCCTSKCHAISSFLSYKNKKIYNNNYITIELLYYYRILYYNYIM